MYAGTLGGCQFGLIDSNDIIQSIKNAIKDGYTRILFDNLSEAVYFDHIRKIHRIINQVNDFSINYVYLCSALNGQEAYDLYCAEHNISPILDISCMSIFEHVMKDQLETFYKVSEHPVLEYIVEKKSKIFCCFNKAIRQHRVELFYRILHSNFLEKSYSSFEFGKDIITRLKKSKYRRIHYTFNKHADIFPLRLNVPEGRCNPIDVQFDDLRYHNDSYFSLVTETLSFNCHSDYYANMDAGQSIFLTEKTFRPIAFKHPFIIVSRPHSLAYLKKLGYKTFSPYIDESYDLEDDDTARLNLIWKEVTRLSNFTDDQWIEWQKNVSATVEHNYTILMDKTYYHFDQSPE